MNQKRFSERGGRPQQTGAAETGQKENLEKSKSKLLQSRIDAQNQKAKKDKGEEDAKGRTQMVKQTPTQLIARRATKAFKNVDQNKVKKETEEQKVLKQLQIKAEKLEMKLDDPSYIQSASSYQKIKEQSEQLRARIAQLQKEEDKEDEKEASRPEEQPFEQALGAPNGNVEHGAAHRKVSNEIDFDSHLCNKVDMLLNQNERGHRMKKNEDMPSEANQQ